MEETMDGASSPVETGNSNSAATARAKVAKEMGSSTRMHNGTDKPLTAQELSRTVHRSPMPLQSTRGTFTKAALLAPLVGALVLFAACSGGASAKGTTPSAAAAQTVTGTFVLHGDALWTDLPTDGPEPSGIMWSNPVAGADCQGKGGYSDIGPGLQVLLKDGATVLDVATFGQGAFGAVPASPTHYTTPQDCTFTFTLHVPAGHKFYTVSVGHRGDNTYSYAQITAPGTLSYQLGTS